MTCKYYKCDNEVIGRSDKVYCCKKHKVYQWRYRKSLMKRISKHFPKNKNNNK